MLRVRVAVLPAAPRKKMACGKLVGRIRACLFSPRVGVTNTTSLFSVRLAYTLEIIDSRAPAK
jgi:hypothetical protein